jgi:hypothetical protein
VTIILTAEQAEKVRGISPTNPNAALDPIPLKDGTFMLPKEVLTDPAHADVKELLSTLPLSTDIESKRYKPGDTVSAEVRNRPRLEDVGTRVRLRG